MRPNKVKDLQIESKSVATATTLTPSDCGKTIFLNLAGGFVTTLPLPKAGYRFKFVVSTAPTGSYTIVTNGSANIIKGHILTNDVNSATDADFEVSGGDTITFVLNKAVAGDLVELECDGTSWFVNAACTVFDAITITTAS